MLPLQGYLASWRTAAFPDFQYLSADHGGHLALPGLMMKLYSLKGKAQGCREQRTSDEQSCQAIGQE